MKKVYMGASLDGRLFFVRETSLTLEQVKLAQSHQVWELPVLHFAQKGAPTERSSFMLEAEDIAEATNKFMMIVSNPWRRS